MPNDAAATFWNTPQREGVLISDLSRFNPSSAVSSKRRDDCWFTVPYETKDGINGVLIGKGELSSPPDVSLPLESNGWHAIYLGLFRGGASVGQPFADPCLLKVKLSDDGLFDTVRPTVLDTPRLNSSVPGSENGVEELFWRASDLDGQDMVLSYPRAGVRNAAQLAFIRLVPMTEEEVEDYRNASGSSLTKVLAAQYDGGSGYDYVGMQTVDDLLELHEPMRDTDVGKLFLGTGSGGTTWYPTNVSEMHGEGEEALLTEQGRRRAEILRSYVSRGIDPVRAQVEHVQSMGIGVYLGFRMGGPMASVPPRGVPVPFWRDHPEWRCRDRQGNAIPRLSMAYPEVRRFYVDLFLELADYGVEGVQLIYTRRAPVVLFEQPVIEDFKKEYGVDPRELPEDPDGLGPLYGREAGSTRRHPGAAALGYTQDERLQTQWAMYVTTFMRELREGLDSRRRRDGGRLGVVANVLHNAVYNRAAAFDLETWAREGLVDILVPATSDDGSHSLEYDYFKGVTERTGCVFYEDILPRHTSGSEYVRRARQAFDGGAAGLAFWDCDRRTITKSQWNTIKRLGHRDDLDRMALTPADYKMHPLKLIDGWNPIGYN